MDPYGPYSPTYSADGSIQSDIAFTENPQASINFNEQGVNPITFTDGFIQNATNAPGVYDKAEIDLRVNSIGMGLDIKIDTNTGQGIFNGDVHGQGRLSMIDHFQLIARSPDIK